MLFISGIHSPKGDVVKDPIFNHKVVYIIIEYYKITFFFFYMHIFK